MRCIGLTVIPLFIFLSACKKELPEDRHSLKYLPYDIQLVPKNIIDGMQQLLKDYPEIIAKGVFYYKSWDGDGKYVLLLSVYPPAGYYTPPKENDLPAFSDLYTDYISNLVRSKVFLNNSLAIYNCLKIEVYMMFPSGGEAYISYY